MDPHAHDTPEPHSDGDEVCMSPTTKKEVRGVHPVTKFGTGKGDADGMDFPTESSPTTANEFDMAAYAKEELNTTMRKRILERMFSAFDVTQKGFLELPQLAEFCQYVGRSQSSEGVTKMYDELKGMDGKITFDKLWRWWTEHPDRETAQTTFSLVSADFSVPYHQQQLRIEDEGDIFTPSYRVKYYFKDVETAYERQVSPWHDVPLSVRDPVRTKPENIGANRYNFICEIPKWTRAKFEIATGEPFNPIKQDIKNGVPRFYKHGDMMWNYGAFPQTWESTEVVFEDGVYGDNDPIDGVEIGMRQMRVGEVHPVRILGVLGMIDDGQMDWKLICISVNDPVARFIKDITDIPKFLPGCLDAIREWFRVYKICQGGVENKFAFNGEYKDKDFALNVMKESHFMWENLRKIKGKEKV
ncbi:inorganic pyrophosphatase [Strigomonas culicis]|uniref:inorganic diphosphatase n=1 Tax=Strigomonas culicis TaxID=28005 RepID=S9UU44_9TRYP|nr:inorganic pyrophosphatase [Strigomonas culicis]EPY27635.1 inorganic pyrophosphatase [Strigomonas culicis]EPY34462.1 inorganic pyrophosphatase [Strigomonas culicis]|eukprot:EPY23597.1 inorganic pyrophosphatase [Strigomonas culicis]